MHPYPFLFVSVPLFPSFVLSSKLGIFLIESAAITMSLSSEAACHENVTIAKTGISHNGETQKLTSFPVLRSPGVSCIKPNAGVTVITHSDMYIPFNMTASEMCIPPPSPFQTNTYILSQNNLINQKRPRESISSNGWICVRFGWFGIECNSKLVLS